MTQEQLRMQMLAGIITESQYKTKLNEMSIDDAFKAEELANKEVSNYVSKNNLGPVKDIQRFMSSPQGEGRKITSKVTLSTGETFFFETIYGPNLNLISIKQVGDPYDKTSSGKHTPEKFTSKIPDIKVSIDDDGEVNISSNSGDYDGWIEDDGTVSLSVVDDDMGYEEFTDDNWRDILGDNHAFVKIANAINTDVEAIGDYVQITFKINDLK
jgi:hypothetical protein